jgi:hypothetical protein
MSKLVAFIVSAVALALLGWQGPAVAANVSLDDPVGDAKAEFDITRATFGNNAETLSVKARFRNLKSDGTQIFGLHFRPRGYGRSFVASTVRHADGSVTADLYRLNGDSSTLMDCAVRARWQPDADVVVLKVPQNCLAKHRRQFVSAYTDRGDGSQGEPADGTDTVQVPYK